MPTPGVKFIVKVDDAKMQRKIVEVARAAGKTTKEQARVVMKGIIKDVMLYTPPGSQRAQGSTAKAVGEIAIVRDMRKLFIPVILKGKRAEKYPYPHQLHHEAMLRAAGGQVPLITHKYHVDKAKLSSLKNELRVNVGLLASGWARAAMTLGVSVPAWIARHATKGRGTDLITNESDKRLILKVTNHMPQLAGTISAQTQRLVNFAKKAAIGKMERQLPFLLKRAMPKR